MMERAFEEASQYKDNKGDALRQFAITQARQLLEAAGVVDPAIKDQAVVTRPPRAVEQPFFEITEDLGIRFTREVGGKSVEQLEAEAKSVRNVSAYALDMAHNPKLTTLEEVTPQELIKLRVQELGLPGTPTTKQIIERATHSKIGNMALELCRAEVGLHQAIADKEQSLGDYYYIMHEPIVDRHGLPRVFLLARYVDGLWLGGYWARSDGRWDPGFRLVFALRNIEPVKA